MKATHLSLISHDNPQPTGMCVHDSMLLMRKPCSERENHSIIVHSENHTHVSDSKPLLLAQCYEGSLNKPRAQHPSHNPAPQLSLTPSPLPSYGWF